MRRTILAGTALAALLVGPLSAQQALGPPRIKFPVGFEKDFVLYNVLDRHDGKHARFLYINKDAAMAAKPGAELPDGTVVVVQLQQVELDAAGNPVLDDKGRMKPTGKVNGHLVQEKRKGWGEAIPANLRNGDWEYAVFKADFTLNAEVKLEGCYTCHLPRKARDFTFTTFKNFADGFKP